jgi:hypothetical protein
MPGLSSPLLRRAYDHYLEMPGLRLTRPQAQRLWGLDEQTCTTVLNQLLELQLIEPDSTGRYRRTAEGASVTPKLRMARVEDAEAWKTARRARH